LGDGSNDVRPWLEALGAEGVNAAFVPNTFVKIDKSEDRVWLTAEKEQWRKSFAKTVEQTWSNKHTLYCHKIGWGTPIANVIVRIADVGKDIPAGKFVFQDNGLSR
jgi:hypothetical protein